MRARSDKPLFVLPKGSDGLKLKIRAELETKGGKRRAVNWATAQSTNPDGSLSFQLLRRDDPSGERAFSNPMGYSIGVDLGGTNIKIAVVSNDGELIDYRTCDTADQQGSWAQTIKQNMDAIQKERGASACHIGIASPGLAAKDGRSIAHMQGRLNGLQGFVWTDFLDSPRPVVVLNDAHAALLGEVWKGAARGYSNVILLTLGTGVGGALLIDGRLAQGTHWTCRSSGPCLLKLGRRSGHRRNSGQYRGNDWKL